MYDKIRDKIYKNELLFNSIRLFFTPIRVTKEYLARKKMAKKIIEGNRELKTTTNKIFYFGIPEHNNLGDMAQTYCTRKWLDDNYSDYQVIEIRTRASFDKTLIKFIRTILGNEDLFIFQSGYCTRDKNPDHLMHINIMNQFPNQNAVILPQTVKIISEREIKRTKDCFNKCKSLLFIARDSISYNEAKSFVKESQLQLFPDIVTSLIGRMKKSVNKEGVLLCVRNDDEKFYSDMELDTVIHRLKNKRNIVDKVDTNSCLDVWETYKNLDTIIEQKIDSFRKYEVIITDRYHGTIFSLIADTPVLVIKTNDHKVTSGVDWFNGVFDQNSVKLASNLDMACKYAEEILDNHIYVNNTDYFYSSFYLNKLKSIIDKL